MSGRDIFYGWRIVGSASGLEFLLSLLVLNVYGTYAALWRDEFGWSATALAAAFSLHRAQTGLIAPLQGWLLQRYAPHKVMRCGVLILSVGLICLSQIQTLTSFFITFAIMAVGGSLAGFLSLMTVLVNWFERRLTTALALMQTGRSMAGLTVPLATWALVSFGWRNSAFASGVIILVFGLLLVHMMRGVPEDRGLERDGSSPIKENDFSAAELEESKGTFAADYLPGEAMRTRAFWLLCGGHGMAVGIVSAVLVHLIVHLNEGLHYSLQSAAVIFALMTFFMILGQVAGGLIGDRLDKRSVAAAAMLGHASGLLALAFGTSLAAVVFFAIAHGLAWGIRAPLMGALRAEYFGRKSFPTIMGMSSLVVMGGSVAGPILAGVLADSLGSYHLAFAMLSAGAAVGSLFFLLANKPSLSLRLRIASR